MRTLHEIDTEFRNVCMQLGMTYAQKKALGARVQSFLVKLQQLEDEAGARRLVDAEKKKDSEGAEEASPSQPEAAQ